MAQLPAVIVWPHVPSPLQESVVHANPSSQLYVVPPQVVPVQTSFLVQALPSLHAVPALLVLQAVWLVAGVHC
jgi:hypothetical protein